MPYVCISKNKNKKLGWPWPPHTITMVALVTSQIRTLVGILYDLEVDANKYHQKIIKPVKIQSYLLYHVDCDTNILLDRR